MIISLVLALKRWSHHEADLRMAVDTVLQPKIEDKVLFLQTDIDSLTLQAVSLCFHNAN